MPDQVFAALLLLGAQFFVDLVEAAMKMDWAYLDQVLVKVAFFAIVSAMWLYGLYLRQNWLRWITVAYTVFQMGMLPLALPRIHDTEQLAVYCLSMGLGVPAIVLLCLPKARQWYGRNAVP